MWFSFSEYKMLPRMMSDIELVGFASTSENEVSALSIYPNPANHEIFNSNIEGIDQILDAQGRVVILENIQNSNQAIDLRKLESGVYFIAVNGQTSRFVKQ
jgi:hypothetical protein